MIIQQNLEDKSLENVLSTLEAADFWCSKVLDYPGLMKEEGYRVLNMEQDITLSNGSVVKTTRCPIRVDGKILSSTKGAPELGEDTAAIKKEFCLTSDR